MNEFYGKIEGKGLNPYFGVMHSDHEKHPTLASDLMEEWRAVLIDSVAFSMLNGHELLVGDFYNGVQQPGVFLETNAFKKYIQKLEMKFRTENRYLSYVDYSVSFRRAMDLQINQFVKAIEMEDCICKKLNGYGFLVQKSAFEAMITESLYRDMITMIPKMIDDATDSVRVYKIRGQGEVSLFGIGQKIEDEEVVII